MAFFGILECKLGYTRLDDKLDRLLKSSLRHFKRFLCLFDNVLKRVF